MGSLFYDTLMDADTVKLSSKFQVVIPQRVRERMNLKPGTRFRVVDVGGTIEMIPIRPVREMRGRFKDIDTNIEREDDRL
ncbi:MAG: AbrB/MazE/SpoVT family DNA-binding domain-containing protein [Acidobacteria bacterium]|nr:AbrB/MazE/SpoVT family DNA-binding domain-containing protein [Acidobacteriota bacterium]